MSTKSLKRSSRDVGNAYGTQATSRSKSSTPYSLSARHTQVALGLAILVATLAAHSPAFNAGYIWDDDTQLYQNPLIAAPDGLFDIWFSNKPLDYWPLTSTMLWVEWRLWGNNPSPYHVTNIALHALSAVVLWRVLLRLGINNLGAFLGGMLFAVHPVTVASTAWIAERKNVLSMVLYLFSILAYLRFDDENRRNWYVIALLAGAAALLAKTAVVALPIILLMLMWWRHNTITKRDMLRTLPFFLLSIVLGLATVWFQQHNAIAAEVVRPEGLASRIASVGWTFWFYLYTNILPIHLTVIYPRWDIDGSRAISFVPLAMLLAFFAALWYYRRAWCPGPLLALGSFAIVLAPVLGLLTMAYSRHSLVADHLQYPGMPGAMALIGGGLGAAWTWAQGKHMRGLSIGIATAICAIIVTLFALTWQQARIYKDSMTLWTYTIQHNDRAWMAYYNRGTLYSEMRDANRAIQDYTKTIELKPNYAQAYNNRGVAYGDLHEYDQEIRDCSKAIELNPAHAKAYANRGLAYGYKGNREQAIRDFDKSIELLPTYPPAYKNRGITYGQLGDDARAMQDFNKAIELDAGYAQAYQDRATAFWFMKEYDKAWADIKKLRQLGVTPSPALIAELTKASGRTE